MNFCKFLKKNIIQLLKVTQKEKESMTTNGYMLIVERADGNGESESVDGNPKRFCM